MSTLFETLTYAMLYCFALVGGLSVGVFIVALGAYLGGHF